MEYPFSASNAACQHQGFEAIVDRLLEMETFSKEGQGDPNRDHRDDLGHSRIEI